MNLYNKFDELELDSLKILDKLELEFATLELRSDNILRVFLHKNAILDLESVKILHEAYLKICKNKKYYFLFEADENVVYTKEGREYSKMNESNQPSLKVAAVSDKLPYRMVVNFYMKFHQPTKLVRFFSNREKAIEWLLS
jgi:hypothetical protein